MYFTVNEPDTFDGLTPDMSSSMGFRQDLQVSFGQTGSWFDLTFIPYSLSKTKNRCFGTRFGLRALAVKKFNKAMEHRSIQNKEGQQPDIVTLDCERVGY